MRVPVEYRLGEEGDGFKIAQIRLGPARVHHCMRQIGLAGLLIELMLARAAERKTFGRPLLEYDTIQRWIAQSRVELEQAKLLTLKCAWLLDAQGHHGACDLCTDAAGAAPGIAGRGRWLVVRTAAHTVL